MLFYEAHTPILQQSWNLCFSPPFFFSWICLRSLIVQDIWVRVYYFYLLTSNIGTLAKYTGGQVNYYPNFQSAIHGEKLRHELARDLTRETAWEAVLRIRVGKGQPILNALCFLNNSADVSVFMKSSDLFMYL